TTPSVTTVTLGTSSVNLKDSAVLSGGYNPTGSITFTLVYNGSTVDTETVTVSGNGTYTTPTGFTLPISGTVTGTYHWNAIYTGDDNTHTTSENNHPAERVLVNHANPTRFTTPSVTTVTLGTSSVNLKDTADLEGGYHPTGTITFTLFLGGVLKDTETVTVNGNGLYTTPNGFTLPRSGAGRGGKQWNAIYNRDDNNNNTNRHK